MKIRNNVDYISYRKRKKRSYQKKLLFLFFTTFTVVMLGFIWLASVITPEIDIPVLSNEEDSQTITSSDFKGRVDSRLKLIELQDKNPSSTMNPNRLVDKNDNEKSDEDKNAAESAIAEAQSQIESVLNSKTDKNNKNSNIVKTDIDEEINKAKELADNTSTTAESEPKQPVQAISSPPMPTAPAIQRAVTSAPKLALRKKIPSLPKMRMIKVIVGSYATPSQAREASQQISRNNLNVAPFIKQVGSAYALQVGSFTNMQKAQQLANQLKSQNQYVRIIND